MPWDLDIDVQVTESDMYYLAAYFNRTEYYYVDRATGQGRTYLLDINPHHVHRERDDRLNLIDARWIDTTNGLYIDITAARYDLEHEQGQGMMYDKHDHEFRVCCSGLREYDLQLTKSRIHSFSLYWTPLLKVYQPRYLTNTKTS
jgi:phosphorylcholine metabolism protein LicD